MPIREILGSWKQQNDGYESLRDFTLEPIPNIPGEYFINAFRQCKINSLDDSKEIKTEGGRFITFAQNNDGIAHPEGDDFKLLDYLKKLDENFINDFTKAIDEGLSSLEFFNG